MNATELCWTTDQWHLNQLIKRFFYKWKKAINNGTQYTMASFHPNYISIKNLCYATDGAPIPILLSCDSDHYCKLSCCFVRKLKGVFLIVNIAR